MKHGKVKKFKKNEDENEFSIAIQREELASLASTSPNRDEDLIHVKGSRMTITGVHGLENVLQ